MVWASRSDAFLKAWNVRGDTHTPSSAATRSSRWMALRQLQARATAGRSDAGPMPGHAMPGQAMPGMAQHRTPLAAQAAQHPC
jgi:hypothetical protein